MKLLSPALNLGCALLFCFCAPSQAQNAPRAVADNPDAAQLDFKVTESGRTFPTLPPGDVALKPANYPVPDGAIFASPEGKPGASGAQNAPTSLQNALKIAPLGGTVVLRRGNYRVGGLMPTRRLTLQPFPGEIAWLKGSVVVQNWVRDGSAWRHDGWTQKFPVLPKMQEQFVDPKFPLAARRDMVFIDGRPLWQVANKGELRAGTFCFDEESQSLLIADDPMGKVIEATDKVSGLELHTIQGDTSGSVVRGLGFCHYADYGLIVRRASNVTVENCTSAFNAQSGLWSFGAASFAVKNSAFVGNGRLGARIGQSPFLRLEGCDFSFNNIEGYKLSWDAAGVKLSNIEVENPPNGAAFICTRNTAIGNYASGIWMDIDCNDALITHNIARDNKAIGIFFEISHRALIAFNTCTGNGAGVMVSNSTGANVYNNTLVDNTSALTVKNTNRRTLDPDDGDATYATGNNDARNNIVALTKARKKAVFFDAQNSQGAPSKEKLTLESNLYIAPPGVEVTLVKWWQGGARDLTSLEEVRRETGQETRGVAQNIGLVSAPNGVYSLAPGAPLPSPLPANALKMLGVEAIALFGAPPIAKSH